MCSKGHPTVNRQAGARHVAGLSARQVGDETGNLVGIADALQRDRRCYAIDVACRHVGERRRSEEHTSELQSHSDLVCRLLLEKKKQEKLAQSDSASVLT